MKKLSVFIIVGLFFSCKQLEGPDLEFNSNVEIENQTERELNLKAYHFDTSSSDTDVFLASANISKGQKRAFNYPDKSINPYKVVHSLFNISQNLTVDSIVVKDINTGEFYYCIRNKEVCIDSNNYTYCTTKYDFSTGKRSVFYDKDYELISTKKEKKFETFNYRFLITEEDFKNPLNTK